MCNQLIRALIVLPRTFIYAVDVLLPRDDSGQTLHQQKGFMVALD